MKILDIPRSGSYAGITSSKNRFGQYVRNRRSPVNPPGTGRRAFIRAAFGSTSSAWAGLTPTEQASWESYAGDHPITNSLGASIILTGHQMFVAINTQLINVGEAIEVAVPVSDSVHTPAVDAFVAKVGDGLAGDVAGGTAADFNLIAFSPLLSGGRNFNGRYWQAAAIAANAGDLNDYTIAYQAEMGTLVAGRRVFLKITPVNQYGVTGVPLVLLTTVIA